MGVWTLEEARTKVVNLAKKHAKADFDTDRAAAEQRTPDEVATLASEGFWNVVFPKLENQCVDPAGEVDGASIERHYLTTFVAAYAAQRGK